MIYENTDLQIEVLTPTHIGMGQEKNYLRGLDFMIWPNPNDEGKTLYILRPDKIIAKVAQSPQDLQTLTTKLSSGNYRDIEQLLNRLKVLTTNNIVRVELAYDDSMTEIKRQFSNGLGQYLIPGSSLKGAIRSVVYKTLKQREPNAQYDDQLFGKIDTNLMNLLTVSDVVLPADSVKVYRTKVFSADGRPQNGEGQWKHERRGGHSEDFDTRGFVSYYEGIKARTQSTMRIGLRTQPIPQSRLSRIPNRELLYQQSPGGLINLIKAHTRQYLEREAEYYRHYPNSDLGQIAQQKIAYLSQQNETPNACVLRVGANVGFHAITGDWQQNNHISPWIDAKNQLKAKTRKFAFTKRGDGFDFHPMGFIKLSLPT